MFKSMGGAGYFSYPFIRATGGTITTQDIGGTTYNVHTFTSSGSFVVTTIGQSGGTLETFLYGGRGGAGGYTEPGGVSPGQNQGEGQAMAEYD